MTESVSGAAAPAALSWGRAAYDAYAEGLYTYCLSLMRDHEAAARALRGTFVLADRNIGRLPDLELLKPWLYALARFECLVRLDAELPPARGERALGPPLVWGVDPSGAEPADAAAPRTAGGHARRRADLALLAWPETAGLDAARREALELSVRHGLDARGLAAVLGSEEGTVTALLTEAGTHVDEFRAAVAGVRAAASCAEGGDLVVRRPTPAARTALIEHGAACPRCAPHVRLAAARQAPTTGPGAAPVPPPLIAPPDELRGAVLGEIGRGRAAARPDARALGAARFDRAGFPVFRPQGPGARGRRKATFIAAAIVAAVVAAPVAALWQSSRGGGEPEGTTIRSARVAADEAGTDERPPPAAAAPAAPAVTPSPEASGARGGAGPGVAARVTAQAPSPVRPAPGEPVPPAPGAPVPPGPPRPVDPLVEVTHDHERTLVRLTNRGQVPVDWSASAPDGWLRLSATSGTLGPGASVVVTVTVDDSRAPAGAWRATVRVEPGGSVVTIEGTTQGGSPSPSPSPTAPVTPAPSTSPATAPE